MRTRSLLLSILLLLCGAALPLGAQTGSVQVSLTIVEPAQATVEPTATVRRAADGQVQVETNVQLRGAVAWSLSPTAVRPAAWAAAEPAPTNACGTWSGSAAPAENGGARFGQRLTASARCDAGAGSSGQSPLVIVLAAN
ncbi:MAG TPA: hypothetical protein VE871_12570 [Longimicrobium sp.]|nr:hypothetical protein [Longimicrobium sp.]